MSGTGKYFSKALLTVQCKLILLILKNKTGKYALLFANATKKCVSVSGRVGCYDKNIKCVTFLRYHGYCDAFYSF